MRSLKRRLKSILEHPTLLRLVLRLTSIGVRPARDGHHILVAAPGRGNIGDAAMLEAFAAGVSGEVVVIVRHKTDYQSLPTNARSAALPHLIYGTFPHTLRDGFRLRRLLSGARSISIVGADIMDGHYMNFASARRSVVAEVAASHGFDARVLGFSWNSSPTPLALSSIRRAAKEGAVLYARDPASEARLVHAGVDNVRETADIVFSATAQSRLPVELPELPSPYAIVNASAFVARMAGDTVGEYVRLVSTLANRGMHVVLLPHVVRDGADPVVTKEIFSRLDDAARANTTLVDMLLHPSQVRELASGAHVVVTGRMHLSVISLGTGVPTVVVGTQGKVEGMMDRFRLNEFVVQPDAIAGGALVSATTSALEQHDIIEAQVARALPEVVRLAERNFDSLTN